MSRFDAKTVACWIASASICWASAGALAQEFPTKPIRFIVPYAAGGSTDVTARAVAQRMSAVLGQPIVIENKPGASTTIGAEAVAGAPKDGYTVLATAATTFSSNPHLIKNMRYKLADFAPVALMASHPYIVLTSAKVPAKTIPELVAWLKSKSGEVNYGTPGVGTTPHIVGEQFGNSLGVKLVQVNYNGEAPITKDLLGGVVDLQFAGPGTAIAQRGSDKLRVAGVMGNQRLPALPGVPTFAEAGFPDLVATSWFGLFVPAGTPADVVAKLNDAANKAITNDELRKKLVDDGLVVEAMTPEAFGTYVRGDAERTGKTIGTLGIKLD